METKVDETRMEKVRKALNFTNSISVKANGLAGALLLLWTDDIELKCEKISDRILKCTVKRDIDSSCWSLFPCYGTPYRGEKRNFWVEFQQVILEAEGPWLVVGDLNEILDDSEKLRGRPAWKRYPFLKSFMLET